MKTHIGFLIAAGLVAAAPLMRAADDQPAPKDDKDKKALRVLTAPDREHRFFVQRDSKGEKETVAFLGVETSPVSATTSAQLGLARGTGLAVNRIVPKSAAVGVLNENDILLKLDDQILIDTHQLMVLVRNHKEGDDVVVTYLRGGQKATATIKLGKTEVSKFSNVEFKSLPFHFNVPAAGNTFEISPFESEGDGAEVDHVLSMLEHSPNGDPIRIQIDGRVAPGFRAMAVHSGNSNLTYSDNAGSLELAMKDGTKTLVAKNTKGEQVFSGPVNTPEERKAMPEDVRARLEKLEGMHDITFRTDGDFQGSETKVIRPRGIVMPVPPATPRTPAPVFY